ncbi:MAG: FMN-binding protein [Lachnospiraceae bacterium]|nr:FMN-binding protein [Lachnospiraceae bacterium]
MSQRSSRWINFVLILVILFCYQEIALARSGDILRYQAKVEEADRLAKEYERQMAQAENEAYLAEIRYGDGTFSGTGQGFGGLVEMEIVVENHELTEVNTISAAKEDAAYYEQAIKELAPAILKQQGNDVDTVSGATFSSKGILEATGQAIEKAEAARPDDIELMKEREEDLHENE